MATPEEMDAAAREAKAELDTINLEEADAKALIAWHQKWYMKAGHKRIGKIMAMAGKEMSS